MTRNTEYRSSLSADWRLKSLSRLQLTAEVKLHINWRSIQAITILQALHFYTKNVGTMRSQCLSYGGPGPPERNGGPPNSPILWGSKVPPKTPPQRSRCQVLLLSWGHYVMPWPTTIMPAEHRISYIVILLETSLLSSWHLAFWVLTSELSRVFPGSTLAVQFAFSDISGFPGIDIYTQSQHWCHWLTGADQQSNGLQSPV
jgi:hypothetical protein